MKQWRSAVFCAAIWCGWLAVAQTAPEPTLQRRDSASQPDKPTKPGLHGGRSTLPPDASGEYLLDESGSVVEITVDSGKVSGYVTKMGDEQSDKDTPLTFFFDQCIVDGHQLRFTTHKVHGIWYSFEGSIVHGDPKTGKDENGYYRLEGTWTTHNDTRTAQSSEKVSLKSTPHKD
jgi:hypothetical protein